jgi:hypothetical protein
VREVEKAAHNPDLNGPGDLAAVARALRQQRDRLRLLLLGGSADPADGA